MAYLINLRLFVKRTTRYPKTTKLVDVKRDFIDTFLDSLKMVYYLHSYKRFNKNNSWLIADVFANFIYLPT